MSAFVLLLLKMVGVAAAGVFFVCVLMIVVCSVSLLFRGGGSTQSWDFMRRARRIAFWAWLIALIAGLSMVGFALATGQR